MPARQGGPDFALVFEAVGGQDLETIRVPGFFTYAGFQRAFVDRLGDVAELVKRERWVLGAAGEQTAVTAQYDTLGQTLLDLYTREFIAAWRAALAKLQLRRLTADKPKYIALGAAAAATSPIKQLLESIRDETALTRERPKPAAQGAAAAAANAARRLRPCCGNRTRRPAPRSRRRSRRSMCWSRARPRAGRSTRSSPT